jgi:hypothetical protein
MTVEDLMQDRVTLDGMMMKCNQNPAKFRDTQDCENARIAIERLASQNVDPAVEKKRQEEFERAREQLRLSQDRQRQEQDAKTKVDAYTLPVVPVNPPAAPTTAAPAPASPAPASPPPPLAGTTSP